jgi:hypothetical protein
MASIQTLDGNFRGRRKENLNDEFQSQNHPKEDVAIHPQVKYLHAHTHIEEEEVSHQTNTKKCPGVLAPSQIYGGRIIFLRCQKVFNSTKSVKHLLIQESKGNLVIIVNKGSRL